MAKKLIENEPTELITSKKEFESKLQSRIQDGEELLSREIKTQSDYTQLKKDFSDWNDYNSEFLKQSFSVEYNEYKKRYDDSGSFIGLMRSGQRTPAVEFKEFRERIESKVDNLKKLNSKTELLKSRIEEKIVIKSPELNKHEVFIVHGHDDEAKTKVARFIEKLGFKPIILHEQASSSRTVIEKIEEYSNVGFGIVLYTPCDMGAKKAENLDLKNRARQNVVFEHGFLIGKIGRQNVCAMVKDDVETPNDISGVVYIKMENDEGWHLKLARELRSSGYDVDMNKL